MGDHFLVEASFDNSKIYFESKNHYNANESVFLALKK